MLFFTEQTHIILTHCIPARLSWKRYIWYPWQRRQNYYFSIFYFVSIEVGTAASKIFCVMIPSLVDICLDFGLFRVVRPQIWMAAIVDFANTPALSDSSLGIHRKSKEYNLFYICAKFCSFGRICPKISLTAPTKGQIWYNGQYGA